MPRLKTVKTGVYCILHMVSGKRYVGSASRSLKRRMQDHRDSLRERTHYNRYLQAAWDKYGESSFEFIVLCECPPERCIEEEQRFIDLFTSALPEFGYNLSPTAGSTLGTRYTETSKKNIARAKIGRKMSVLARMKMSLTGRRKKKSKAHKEKIAASLAGKPKTEEHRRKLSEAQSRYLRSLKTEEE